jgi:Cytochrome c7 and related cytochrome c
MRRGPATAGAVIAVVAILAAIGWSNTGSANTPEQPIDFSHRDHIRGDRLECALCHSGARRSAVAGLPPVERCMGCHRFVLPANPGVTMLRREWEAGKPIRWVKVNPLPRFVRFNHQAHALAQVECRTCHGDVAAMNRIARVAPLTMGWCVQCHRDRHASDDCLTCHY